MVVEPKRVVQVNRHSGLIFTSLFYLPPNCLPPLPYLKSFFDIFPFVAFHAGIYNVVAFSNRIGKAAFPGNFLFRLTINLREAKKRLFSETHRSLTLANR